MLSTFNQKAVQPISLAFHLAQSDPYLMWGYKQQFTYVVKICGAKSTSKSTTMLNI